MPALASSRLASAGISELEGTRRCPRSTKKSVNRRRISIEFMSWNLARSRWTPELAAEPGQGARSPRPPARRTELAAPPRGPPSPPAPPRARWRTAGPTRRRFRASACPATSARAAPPSSTPSVPCRLRPRRRSRRRACPRTTASPPPPPAPPRRLLLALGGLARRLAQPVDEGARLHQRAGHGRGDHLDHVADRGGDRLGGRQDAVDPRELLVDQADGAVDLLEQRDGLAGDAVDQVLGGGQDRKSTRLNSSHVRISYAVFCLKKKHRAQRLYTREQQKIYQPP